MSAARPQRGDADIVNCLADLLEFRLETEPTSVTPIAALLAEACRYTLHDYTKFEVTPEIYGDVRARLDALQTTLSRLALGQAP